MTKKIAVIGAGVVGLSTAQCLQNTLPSTKVIVFADKFEEETLSCGAGGLFRPEIHVHPDLELVRKWCKDSLSHFVSIAQSSEAENAGMKLVSGYHVSSSPIQLQNKLLKELLPDYRELTQKDLSSFPPHFKNGLNFTTMVTDCRYYLPWMRKKFEKAGGCIVKKHISSFSEIPEEYDIIVNCTGLGAKYLLDDPFVTPIRGQTIKVKAPWIKNFYYGDEFYIIPGLDYVTLGGIKDYGSGNMNVSLAQKELIWEKCIELVPSLKRAEFMWDWVGLRPYRNQVRVDANFVLCNKHPRMIVNNYGHGAHGVTLSWGTALEATKLIQRIFTKKEFILSKL